MNQMLKKLLWGVLLLCASTTLYASMKNVSEFDIGGVKLRMDPKTVIKTLKSYYNLKDEDILVNKKLRWEKYNKDMNLSKVEAFRQAERGKSPDFYVSFCISEENNKSEVRSIEYGIPHTKENMKKMYDMAIKKYGNPTFSSYSKTTHTWCDENKKTRITGSSYKCTKDNPRIQLNLRYSSIALSTNECELNNRKIIEERKNTSPKF